MDKYKPLAFDVKKLWDLWYLRICIILSLFLQVILMLVGSMRKRYKSNLLHLFIWSAFFLADWIAAYTLGQIVRGHGDDQQDPKKSGELYLFWAQVLLLHLAGPDSITTFSHGDNGLWLKQLFALICCQVVATIYSFCLLALVKKNKLWIPTILVFTVALIKWYEKVKILLHASFDRFGEFLLPKPNPGKDSPPKRGQIKRRILTILRLPPLPPCLSGNENRTEVDESKLPYEHKLLIRANSFFENFKVLFTGSYLRFENREKSRKYFLYHYSYAFRLIEYELSFL